MRKNFFLSKKISLNDALSANYTTPRKDKEETKNFKKDKIRRDSSRSLEKLHQFKCKKYPSIETND